VRGEACAARLGDDRCGGPRFEGAREVIVAVARFALDGEKQVAGRKRAGVDRHAATGAASFALAPRARASVRPRSTARSFRPSSAARAASASENGKVRSPTIWPVSCLSRQSTTHRRIERFDRGADRLAAIGELARPRRGGENGGADRPRFSERGLSSVT